MLLPLIFAAAGVVFYTIISWSDRFGLTWPWLTAIREVIQAYPVRVHSVALFIALALVGIAMQLMFTTRSSTWVLGSKKIMLVVFILSLLCVVGIGFHWFVAILPFLQQALGPSK